MKLLLGLCFFLLNNCCKSSVLFCFVLYYSHISSVLSYFTFWVIWFTHGSSPFQLSSLLVTVCLPACDYPFLPNGLHLRATVCPPSCVCIRPCILVFFVGLSCFCVHISRSEPFCAPHTAILKSPHLPSSLSSCPFVPFFL